MTETYKKPDPLILNSPYTMPSQHWRYNRELRRFTREKTRRPAGYITATPNAGFDDPGIFNEIELVNDIRERVDQWRRCGYIGISGTTKKLLEHWQDTEQRTYPFFFCQLEAIETLIWLTESHPVEKTGIDIPSDGSDFQRICAKMATGTGKTVVMAMVIAWQILNKANNRQDTRFSKNILIIAPNLTVKSRLAVLKPDSENNYYDEFNIVPSAFQEKLNQGRVVIENWHKLQWEDEEKIAKKKSVDKRGMKSDEAYAREVLGDMKNARNFVVINDEGHHAWRVPPGSKMKGVKKEDIQEAAIWVSGLDRLHQTRGILKCFDFSATPFIPTGKRSSEENLFGWIVSDFGLNDAIESGLVKTPRVVIRDDAQPDAETHASRFYHLYMDSEVRDDLNQKQAKPHFPLPDIVTIAYNTLGADWQVTKEEWSKDKNSTIPPVMITVTNTTETAARIEYTFNDGDVIHIDGLCERDKILRIDSRVLDKAEIENRTKKDELKSLRDKLNTVGKEGKKGEQIQNVISVAMLSEGWDARNVTHIMGLRAFSSQLLCEQVVGRGLRRMAYDIGDDGLFEAEYVNVFGVPFTFLPHEEAKESVKIEKPKTIIRPLPEREEYAISFPNIVRIDTAYKHHLTMDWEKVENLTLHVHETPTLAEMAVMIDGKPNFDHLTEIDFKRIAEKTRMQTVIFREAKSLLAQMRDTWEVKDKWKGSEIDQMAQLVKIAERFIRSGKIIFSPDIFDHNPLGRKVMIMLNMSKIVHHMKDQIGQDNRKDIQPIFDQHQEKRSTGDMREWMTAKPCYPTIKSHINFFVADSTNETTDEYAIDHYDGVVSWVKNDHLGFEILYVTGGAVRKYRPDFIIKLANGIHLILETKGLKRESQETKDKESAADIWVKAVNRDGRFGEWRYEVSREPREAEAIIDRLLQ